MGQSTRQLLYRAVLILVISIENYILCDSSSEEDSGELLEPAYNVFLRNDSPHDKLMNTLRTVAAAKGLLPETRPMWPQRLMYTQIEDPKALVSSKPQQTQFTPKITSVFQNPYTTTSPKSPVLSEACQSDPRPSFISSSEFNHMLQSNSIDRFLPITPTVIDNNNLNIISHREPSSQNNFFVPVDMNNFPSNPNMIQIPPEYINTVQLSGFPTYQALPGLNVPSPESNPSFITIAENNFPGPVVYSKPIAFAPISYPSFVAPSSPSPTDVMPNIIIINPSLSDCKCDEQPAVKPVQTSEIISETPSVENSEGLAQSDTEIQHVPYNLEVNVPVLTRLVPSTDSGMSLSDYPVVPSSPVFPPIMEYPSFPFPPPPMPFLPPIIIQAPKSKSNNLIKILLLSQLLPLGFGGSQKGNNNNCCQYIPVPCPIPFPAIEAV